MQITTEDILNTFGTLKVKQIRNELEAKKINASGRLSDSVKSEVTRDGFKVRLTISALEYISTVDIGRKPTENRSGGFDVGVIERWITAKRLTIPSGFTLRSFAFVIWRKINREGTNTFRNPRKIITPVIEEGLNDIDIRLSDNVAENIKISIAQWQR